MQEADKREQRELISILIKGRGLKGGGSTGGLSQWLDQGVQLVLTQATVRNSTECLKQKLPSLAIHSGSSYSISVIE